MKKRRKPVSHLWRKLTCRICGRTNEYLGEAWCNKNYKTGVSHDRVKMAEQGS